MKFLLTLFILTLSIGTVSAGTCTLLDASHAGPDSNLKKGEVIPAAACQSYKDGEYADKYKDCECAEKEETTPVIAGESQCGDDKVAGKIGGEKKKKDEGGNAGAVEN